MRFEERDLTREVKGYGEPVLPEHLREGEVYFAVVFLDKDSLVPTMEPRVFVGTKVESDGNKLYFQDFVSYQRGIRFESPNADEEATFVTGAGRYIFEYEKALNILMACALRRRKDPDHK